MMTRKELIRLHQLVQEEQRRQVIPIDFESLAEAGIMRKATGSWYEVMDRKRLPKYVSAQATGSRHEKTYKGRPEGNPEERFFLRFDKQAIPAS